MYNELVTRNQQTEEECENWKKILMRFNGSEACHDNESGSNSEAMEEVTPIVTPPPLPPSKTNNRYAWITAKSKPSNNNTKINQKSMEKKTIDAPKAGSTNRFSLLKSADATKGSPKQAKPAPIYLREKPTKQVISLIESILGKDAFHTISVTKGSVAETKIQVYSEDSFRKLTKKFDDQGKAYYTFQLKSAKGLCVVVKGLESDLSCEEIKAAIEEQGFEIKSVFNIQNRFKVPQPLHRVELAPASTKPKKGETHPIYDLRYLLHRRVTVEEPRKRSGPVQCQNCQEFGHTKTYCRLPAVCVICGDRHKSATCNSDRNNTAAKKCCNCGGNHTANFRGCPVFAHIKNKATPQIVQKAPAPLPPAHTLPGVSYASMLGGNQKPQQEQTRTPIQPDNHSLPSSTDNLIHVLTQTITQFMGAMQAMMQEMTRTQSQIMQLLLANK